MSDRIQSPISEQISDELITNIQRGLAGRDRDATQHLPALVGELVTRFQRLEGVLSEDLKVARLHYDAGRPLEMQFEHWAVKMIGMSLYDTLTGLGGENYVTVDLTGVDKNGDREPLQVTIQRKLGKTPAQIASEAKARANTLETNLDSIRAIPERWRAEASYSSFAPATEAIRTCAEELDDALPPAPAAAVAS